MGTALSNSADFGKIPNARNGYVQKHISHIKQARARCRVTSTTPSEPQVAQQKSCWQVLFGESDHGRPVPARARKCSRTTMPSTCQGGCAEHEAFQTGFDMFTAIWLRTRNLSICNVGADLGTADGCSTRRLPSPAMVLYHIKGFSATGVTHACSTRREGSRVSWVRASCGWPTSACHPLVCQVTCAQFGHILDTNVFGFPSGHYF